MANKRQAIFWIVIGTNGVGKTTLVENLVKAEKRNVLIVDPDGGEKAWYRYPEIEVEQIEYMTNHKCRFIAPEKEDIEYFKNFRNGLMVLDDCNHYFRPNLQFGMKQILVRRRQMNVDIIAVAHSLTEVPVKFWSFATHLILFKTGPLRKSANIPMFIKEEGHIDEVNKHPNRHHHKVIKLR